MDRYIKKERRLAPFLFEGLNKSFKFLLSDVVPKLFIGRIVL